MIDLNSLEAKANAASKGDWLPGVVPMPEVEKGAEWWCVGDSYESTIIFAGTGPTTSEQGQKDAEFISAAKPANVLELIRELRGLRAREKACETMGEAQKFSLIRMAQEICRATGLDELNSSPSQIVAAAARQAEELREARAGLEYVRGYVESLVENGEAVHAVGLLRDIDGFLAEKGEPRA